MRRASWAQPDIKWIDGDGIRASVADFADRFAGRAVEKQNPSK